MMISCENLVKIYKTKETEVLALQGLDLEVEEGELIGIIGNSGSGKSTLLNMLGALDKPSAGSLTVDGKNLLKFGEKDMIKYRRETVGFVWQNNARNLIPYLTALENIQMVMRVQHGRLSREDKQRARELLDLVGLSKRARNKLSELSGGEQQRVAIGIGLAGNPRLLLADEPTGAVDTKTADVILNVFRQVNREFGTTIVIVTHDMMLSRKVDRVVAIRDGKTSSEFIRRKNYSEELEQAGGFLDEESHEELAVLDRAGRLQLPKPYMDKLGIENRDKLRVELQEDKIVLYPVKEEN